MKVFYIKVVIAFILSACVGYLGMRFILGSKVSLNKATSNLGMTFAEFKGRYYAKAIEQEQEEFSIYLADIKKSANTYTCVFPTGVVMQVDVEDKTDYIKEISVGSQPLKGKAKIESAFMLLNQSTIYGLAAMVFSPKMESQIWRENVIRRLIDKVNFETVQSDKLRCRSFYIDNTLIFVADSAE